MAWVSGRCEIGPRALGHRSLLASAFIHSSSVRLNGIKQRESFRPVAPACLEADLGELFDESFSDPYMLRFRRALRPAQIPAAVHQDGSARVQTVSEISCPALYPLLMAVRNRHGVGIVCNTSLNFNGRGFINRTSDLLRFCREAGLRNAVVGPCHYSLVGDQ